jgi:hypothetical protein
MRDRHFPRLCRSCQAPMARQEGSCWRCGAQWASEDVPPTKLRAIAGGLPAHPVAEPARAQTSDDDDRWTNEGGSVGSERSAPPVRAVAARR